MRETWPPSIATSDGLVSTLEDLTVDQLRGILMFGVCSHASNPWSLCGECERRIRELISEKEKLS